MKDVVPFVEKTYRVRSDARAAPSPASRWEADRPSAILAAHPDAFAYVAIWSAGVRPEASEAFLKDAKAAPRRAGEGEPVGPPALDPRRRKGLRPARDPST